MTPVKPGCRRFSPQSRFLSEKGTAFFVRFALSHEAVGEDVNDASGMRHRGIVEVPVPILRADRERIRAIRKTLYEPEYAGVTVADFSDVAQKCHVYEDYIQAIAEGGEVELHYYGIGLCGTKKLINKLTGSMPLLR